MRDSRPDGRYGFKIFKIAGMVCTGIIFAVVIALLLGFVCQLLWNWLMPDLFGFGTITYIQGFGLVLLAKILFGGFGKNVHDKHEKCFKPWFGHRGFRNMRKGAEHFEEFWDKEGRTAFKEYVKRKEEAGQ